MAIDLSPYNSIQSNLFVRIQIDEYRTSAGATPTQQILRFSDSYTAKTINGEQYLNLGGLVGISATTNQLKTSAGSLTITISGIPNTSIAEIVHSKIKGSLVQVWRGISDASTGQLLNITGNPAGRFFGLVSNYTLDEDYDVETRTATNTIGLICASMQEVLDNKIAGRKTNPTSHKSFYPTDLAMDRVPNLVGATFNFGAPQ